MSERLNELPDQDGSISHPRIISPLGLEKWLLNPENWDELLKCLPAAVKAVVDENEGDGSVGVGHHPVGGWFCLMTQGQGPVLAWAEWFDGTSAHYEAVKEFHRKGNQLICESPQLPPPDVRLLRSNLLYEEMMETIHALGCDLVETVNGIGLVTSEIAHSKHYQPNLVEIIDGCADVAVVTTGTLISCGVKDTPLYDLVDKNNLDKFGKGHSIRADGKVIKPKDHTPPDIEGFLRNHALDARYEGEE